MWLYDANSLQLIRKTNWQGVCSGSAVAFSPNGQRLAAAEPRSAIHLLDVSNGRRVRTLPGLDQKKICQINDVAFTPDGRHLLTSTLRLWDVASGSLVRTLTGATPAKVNDYNEIALSRDGHRAAMVTENQVGVWDIDTGRKVWSRPETDRVIDKHVALASGDRLVISARRAAMAVYDASTGERLQTISTAAEIKSIAASPDGNRLVTAHTDGTIRV